MRRWIVLLTIGLLAIGATMLGMAPALAGPGTGSECTGFDCPEMRGFDVPGAVPPGSTATLHYQWNAVTDSSVHPITFRTHDDARLIPQPADVRLDGAVLPAAAVAITGSDLTVDLVAAHASPLAAHDLTFVVTTTATMPQRAVSWAELAITHGTDTGRSTSNDIVIHRAVAGTPDLFLVAGQENGGQGLTLPRGHTGTLGVDVDNRGAAAAAVLTITVPATPPISFVRLRDDSTATTYRCTTSGSTISCPIGQVSGPRTLRLDVTVPVGTPVGQRGTVGFSVAPASGADADPSDNTASARIIVGPTADLYASASPGRVAVGPGGTAQITVRVRNQGPDPRSNATLRLWIPPDTADNFAFASFATSAGTISRDGAAFLIWSPGRLGPGQIATATVTVRAVAAEPAEFLVEGAYRPLACAQGQDEADCPNVVVPLTVTAPAPAVTGPAAPHTGGGSGLADTGSSTLALGSAAALLAATGVLLALVGRRRRPDRSA